MREINRKKFNSFVIAFRFINLIGSICQFMQYNNIIFTKKLFIHNLSNINKKAEQVIDLLVRQL